MRLACLAPLLAFALVTPLAAQSVAAPSVRPTVGLEVPLAGSDGGDGLAVRDGIALALRSSTLRLVVRDSSLGGVRNPHQDEGRDNAVDLAHGPLAIAAFSRSRATIAAVGGLRRNTGDADARAAGSLPLIVFERAERTQGAFCLCPSPLEVARFAARAARAHGLRRLAVVAIEPAPQGWAQALARVAAVVAYAQTSDEVARIARARRAVAAHHADAVLVLADEREPLLVDAPSFARGFDAHFVRQLTGRAYTFHFARAPQAREWLVVPQPDEVAESALRAAFRAAYRAPLGSAALYGYAAGQIVAVAASARGASRRAVLRNLTTRVFATALGPVAFDADGYRRAPPLRLNPQVP